MPELDDGPLSHFLFVTISISHCCETCVHVWAGRELS